VTKADKWVKGCLRKKRMSASIVVHVVRRATKDGVALRPYECPYCFAWHVTSQAKSRESAR